jgi:hypothetical protein
LFFSFNDEFVSFFLFALQKEKKFGWHFFMLNDVINFKKLKVKNLSSSNASCFLKYGVM